MTFAQQIWDACETRTEIADLKHLMEHRELKSTLSRMTKAKQITRISKGVYIRAGNRPEDDRGRPIKAGHTFKRVWGI